MLRIVETIRSGLSWREAFLLLLRDPIAIRRAAWSDRTLGVEMGDRPNDRMVCVIVDNAIGYVPRREDLETDDWQIVKLGY